MIKRNDLCWCGSGLKWKKCHYPKEPQKNLPSSQTLNQLKKDYLKHYDILIKTPKQIEGIRASCHLATQILEATCLLAKEGVTTLELNHYAHQLHLDAKAIPAPLHYGSPPFPKSICTSLNEVICHGIPDSTPLKKGDIVNIDVTCILDGYFGDCSKMVVIGQTSAEKQNVVEVSYQCLIEATAILKPGILISDIGVVIDQIAQKHGCSVVDQFVGHGVGVHFHEGPQISHTKNHCHIPLVPGMTFTIEPMINAGKKKAVIDPNDHWTARTIDNKPSAQWEYTLLITEEGHEILTPWKKDTPHLS